MSAPHPPVNLREGDTIAGKYVVERILGAGGMGVVLAARHAVLGSRVAIKVLLPAACAIPGATERFVREARAAAAMHGEHVARVVDVGTLDDGMPYLVMEYLTGNDLRDVLRSRGALPVEEVAEYLVQVCDAMAEAHALGIVHRDLKPGNLFLTARPNGTPLVKVLDFGLAKVLDGASEAVQDASLTATGLVIGSPPYMPPEQLRSLKLADARSDLWSLGVILYELLTGRQPFVGEGMEGVLVAIVADEPAPPRSLRPEIPEAIEALILRCLRKNPNERVQTAQEIAEVLSPFAALRRSAFGSVASMIVEGSGVAPAIASAVQPGPTNPSSERLVRSGAQSARTLTASHNAGTGAPTMSMPSGPASGQDALSSVAPMQSGKSAGDATTLTLGSSEVRTAASATRLPNTFAWTIGALGAAVVAVVIALAVGLGASGQDQEAASAEPAVGITSAAPPSITSAAPPIGDTTAASPSPAPAIIPDQPASGGAPAEAPPVSTGGKAASSVTVPVSRPQSTVPGAVGTATSKTKPAGAATIKPKADLLKQW